MASELRLAFGNAAADYERGRAEWPDEIAEVVGLPPESDVLDLAAGTGKLTRVLARRFAHVIAVEPSAEMRALIGGAEVLDGSAEAIPLADGSVHAVFCGDAFHWFDWPAAIAEIARVLRPRGALVLAWNVPGGGAERRLPQEAEDVIARHRPVGVEPGGPIYEAGVWRDAFTGSPFEPLRETALEREVVRDREGVVARMCSGSIFAAMPSAERATMAAELLAVLPDVTYRGRLRAEIYWTRLR